ncbi:ClpX C4-type zinc finger protein [bacterium]|nr:ClpX C4-type zinc finger protein [bacterium]
MDDKKVVSFGKKQHKPVEKHVEKPESLVYCSFCKRPNTQVPKMVKGPGVNICSECTLIAVQYLILQDGLMSADAQKIIDLLWGKSKK